MNQIICVSSSTLSNSNKPKASNKISKKKKLFEIQFFIISLTLISILVYYICMKIDIVKKEKISKNLAQSFGITKIYNNDYNATRLNQEVILSGGNAFSVIGKITINKLNISYPILDDINIDALKIGICRFYGSMPNKVRKSLHSRA